MDPAATPQAGNGNRQKFDRDDACYLKSNPSFVGHVCRTHYDVDDHEPLGEILILRYTDIPEKDIMDFMTTGMPPKGYVFVSFSEPSQGNALIHENDLGFLDRILELGEAVKRHPDDTASGLVISVSATCTLEPIAFRNIDPITGDHGPLRFTEKPARLKRPLAGEEDGIRAPLLYDIPLSELTKHEEFTEGDYIVYHQKIGVITEVERDPIVLLPNQKVVSPLDPFSLEVPLCSNPKTIVSLPETDALKSHALWNGEFIWTSETEFLFPGQVTLTSRSNIDRADLGSDCPGSLIQGYVIATPPMDIHIDWLCPNIFASIGPTTGPNSEVLRASSLQGTAVKCDFGRAPSENSGSRTIKCDNLLEIGDRVRFRNPGNAVLKHPKYQHIPPDESFGYDVNVFRIVSSKTEVTVRWQDGSITTENAASMHQFSGADDEVWPGNLVVLKDGIERVGVFQGLPLLTSPERERETLRLPQIGVVQTVDGRERIASVRWYENADVQVLFGGGILKPSSSLGKLGDIVTEVSIYELTSYSGLSRFVSDLVVLAPEAVHQSVLPKSPPRALTVGPCQLSWLSPIQFQDLCFYLSNVKTAMVDSEWFKNNTTVITSPSPRRYSIHNDSSSARTPIDFFGKIVSMDPNGVITVRLTSANSSRDISVPLERILMVIDLDDTIPAVPLLPPINIMGPLYSSLFRPEDDPRANLNFEYEGGERIDDEGGDDDWMTENESDEAGSDKMTEIPEIQADAGDDVVAPEVSEIIPPERSDADQRVEYGTDDLFIQNRRESSLPAILSFPIPPSCPPGFCVLESLPPADHRFLGRDMPGVSGIRMKRIQKECEILASSLPPGIFVRTWESRMDLLRVMIVGPVGTPYEHAPFLIDVHFTEEFPNHPPSTFFHSWTNGQGMVNPNLYEDGKICLSILGTWPTENPNETWSPSKSTVLQILVSIMGLVLVKAPFYNEAGYEALAAEDNRRVESSQYTEKAFLMTRKFIHHAINKPVHGFEDVLAWHYLPDSTSTRPQLLRRAISEALGMIEHHNRTSHGQLDKEQMVSSFFSRLSLGAVVMLRKHVTTLEKLEANLIASTIS